MITLFTSSPASGYVASKRFYEAAVGLQPVREALGRPHRDANYDLRGPTGHSDLFSETAELDEVVARIDAGGYRIFDTSCGGRTCIVEDPFGNRFDLIDADRPGDV